MYCTYHPYPCFYLACIATALNCDRLRENAPCGIFRENWDRYIYLTSVVTDRLFPIGRLLFAHACAVELDGFCVATSTQYISVLYEHTFMDFCRQWGGGLTKRSAVRKRGETKLIPVIQLTRLALNKWIIRKQMPPNYPRASSNSRTGSVHMQPAIEMSIVITSCTPFWRLQLRKYNVSAIKSISVIYSSRYKNARNNYCARCPGFCQIRSQFVFTTMTRWRIPI